MIDSAHFEHLRELGESGHLTEAIQESRVLLAQAIDSNEKASLLTGLHVFYCQLGRLREARQTLDEMKRLDISDLGIRLNAEFCEPTLLLQEGRSEEGLSALAGMLDQYSEAFKKPGYRYLYEDIQRRRALTLVGLSRFTEALSILREVVSFSFDHVTDEQQVHFALGVCLEHAKNIEAAKHEFIRAITFGLKNDIEERALWRLGILYYKAGALAQAKQQLETILRDFPSQNPAISRKQIYEALSQTHRDLGDKDNAKHYSDLATRLG
jgi:tetratricopeptide (TPR) repeat protein